MAPLDTSSYGEFPCALYEECSIHLRVLERGVIELNFHFEKQ
jgi:hypothetical protein